MKKEFFPKPCSFNDLEAMAKRLRLTPMVKHVADLANDEQTLGWSIAQWLSVIFKTEIERRDTLALNRHLKEAEVSFEDACYNRIDWSPERMLDAVKINNIFSLQWIERKQNGIITGSTGCGKSWLASAIAVEACLKGYKVRCFRMHALLRQHERFQDSVSAEKDLQAKFVKDLSKLDVIVVDDWLTGLGSQGMERKHRAGLLNIITQCDRKVSFVLVGVPPVSAWTTAIGDVEIADSVQDRLVQRALRLELKGPSMRARKEYGGLPEESGANQDSA